MLCQSWQIVFFRSIPKGNTDNWGERFESIKELVDAEDWKNECEYYQLLYYDLNNDKGKFSEQIEAIVKNIKWMYIRIRECWNCYDLSFYRQDN